MNTKTITRTITTTDSGLVLSHKPAEDDCIVVAEKDGKITLRYLVQDEDPQRPDEMGDDALLLVNYHRDFHVTHDNIIQESDVRSWFEGSKIPQVKTYWIFPLGMYSHSGVCLKLGNARFTGDSGGWDSSMVGIVLASKKEWHFQKKAEQAALCYVEEWNNYLSGNVWGFITDVFDAKTKARIEAECDSCWGYNGRFSEIQKQLENNEL